MTRKMPLVRVLTGFWHRRGGLAFFGTAAFLIASFAVSTAALRLLVYITIAAFAVTNGRRMVMLGLRHSTILQVLALYLAFAVLSLAWQDELDPMLALRALRTAVVIMLFVLFIAWVQLRSRPSNGLLAAALQVFCWAAAFGGILSLGLHFYHGGSIGLRISTYSPTGNPVNAAAIYGVALLALLALRQRIADRFGWTAVSLLALSITCLMLMTYSRGPWIAGFAGILVLLSYEGRWRAALMLALLGVAMTAFLMFGFFDGLEVVQRGDSYRLAIWRDALEQIGERPIFGWGISATTNFGAEAGLSGWKSSHNAYLGTLFQTGLVGLTLLLALVAISIRRAVQLMGQDNLARLYLAILVFGLFVAIFNTPTFYINAKGEWLIFWLPIALLAGLELYAKPAVRAALANSSGKA